MESILREVSCKNRICGHPNPARISRRMVKSKKCLGFPGASAEAADVDAEFSEIEIAVHNFV